MIYIQSNSEGTLPHHGDAASALYGAIDSGIEYRLITFERMMNFPSNSLFKQNLFVGSTEFMREVFKRVDKNPKLPLNSDRPHITQILGEVRARVELGEELFIKPTQIKLFTGLVVNKMWINSVREFSDDTEVMVYNVIKSITSEWRLYIHNHQIIDSKNYSGNFRDQPSYTFAEGVIKKYKNIMPCAYTMDIGKSVEVQHHSFVVEFNDMWAIGNYGVPNDLYLRMLKDRYFEIIKL
jgi:hypothetical protein